MEMLDDDPNIPTVELNPTPKPKDKSLRTNHSCAICGIYGHYSHHCPDLPDYRAALYEMNNLDLETAPTTIEEIYPPVSSPSGEVNTIYMISSTTTPSSTDLTTTTFHTDEEILEALTAPDYPWDEMHHRSYFIPEASSSSTATPYAVESKDFLPTKVDWFKDPIPAPDAFEEGNMANISPVIQVDIAAPGRAPELITLGAFCSKQEIEDYIHLFKEFRDVFAWSYTEMPGLDPAIIEHHIDTWPDVPPIRQSQGA